MIDVKHNIGLFFDTETGKNRHGLIPKEAKNISFLFCIYFIFLFTSCDRLGNVNIVSRYPSTIVVYMEFDNPGEDGVEYKFTYEPGEVYFTRINSRINIYFFRKVRIETPEGEFITEYSPEYLARLQRLRNAYITKKDQKYCWVFTEHGLFIETEEIARLYYTNREAYENYYKSEQPWKELEALLNG
jgi:hypothetical protein